MHSGIRFRADGQRDGRQQRNGVSDGQSGPDGTVEISVTSQTAGTSASLPALTAAP